MMARIVQSKSLPQPWHGKVARLPDPPDPLVALHHCGWINYKSCSYRVVLVYKPLYKEINAVLKVKYTVAVMLCCKYLPEL